MKEIMTRPAIRGELGIRVTKYQQE